MHARSTPVFPSLLLGLLLAVAAPALAHTDDPGSLPLRPHSVALRHQSAAEVVALFAREQLPPAGVPGPRAARPDAQDSLLPGGVDAVYRGAQADEVVVVAREGSAEVLECIAEVDVPAEQVAPGRERRLITLRHAPPAALRAAILRLPDGGAVSVRDHRLTLEGSPAWMHRALRQVLRAELNLPLK